MAGIECTLFGSASGIIGYYIDGVLQPTDGSQHFELSNSDYIHFEPNSTYQYGLRTEKFYGIDNDYTFNSPIITVNNFRNTGTVYLNGNTSFSNSFLAAGSTNINGNVVISSSMNLIGGIIHIENGYLNMDNAVFSSNYTETFEFGSNAQLQITSSSNGKTLIKAATVSGTITLDVQSGVQEGDTFSIEATDNQLVITDGEWTATPSTSGNITTYTLAKATLQKPKFRLLYTVG